MQDELTREQIERQDFVDNEIFALLQELAPAGAKMEWDIEAIGDVRDAVCDIIVHRRKLMSERDFYGFIDIPDGA
ncbi:MAG: hypothetical protein ACR2P5_08285 [Gammaproteobacteria bacterium]